MIVDNRWSLQLNNDVKNIIFSYLDEEDVVICSAVCKEWQQVAEKLLQSISEKFFTKHSLEKDPCILDSKKVFAYHPQAGFFSFFPAGLQSYSVGKMKNLPYIDFNESRTVTKDMIKPSELPAPITVGRISVISKDKETNRFTFLAIRFINRKSKAKNTNPEVSVWIQVPKQKSWMFISGSPFPLKDGMTSDFCIVIKNIDSLVKDYINNKAIKGESQLNASRIAPRRKVLEKTVVLV